MYGTYNENFSFTGPDISLSFSGPVGKRRYRRECSGKRVEKNLASDIGRIIINPVEPVNLPDGLTSHLEISFDPVVLKPVMNRLFTSNSRLKQPYFLNLMVYMMF